MGDVVGIERPKNSVRECESEQAIARRLIRAGWSPRVRGRQTIWKRPSSGFWYAQEVAMALVEAEEDES